MSDAASQIEVIRPPGDRRFRLALFDFDGTLSLIREGWPEVMISLMVEVLGPLASGLSREELRASAAAYVAETTGQQTMRQMAHLARRVAECGGNALEPRAYKAEYRRRLLAHIAGRREALASGALAPDRLLVAGAREMLEAIAARGIPMALFSGTDQEDVREEARLLGVARCFEPRIYGALDDFEASEKAVVVARLMAASDIPGRDLLVFGDGYVEIEAVKQAGGYAVGVASDEASCGGRASAWKRERLIRAGADAIVADFSAHAALASLLLTNDK